MNSTSYMFSFVLGLIVVVVFLVVLNSRFHFMSNLFKSANGKKITIITPTPEPTETPFPTKAVVAQSTTATPTRQPTNAPRVLAQSNPSPTLTSKPQPTRTPTLIAKNNQIAQNTPYQSGQVKGVSQIPNTGSPTELLPLLGAAIFAGFKLRRVV